MSAVAETVLRLELASGSSLELVRKPGYSDVMILARDHKEQVILDLTPDEARQLAAALG